MSKKVYGVVSDQHHHSWNAFSHTLPTGVNNRLQMIVDEFIRMAKEVKSLGGDLIVNAGDVFHVRGSLEPAVLNPVQDAYRYVIEDLGMRVVVLAGNHDLATKESNRLNSAITSLERVGCRVVHQAEVFEEDKIVMIPWNPAVNSAPAKGSRPARIGLKEQLEETVAMLPKAAWGEFDLFIHAPVDGVIDGLPDHGLDAKYLAGLGFRNVMAGHYHNHKYLGDGVWSIGSSTQQTWGDIGTKAGYLIVTDGEVSWRASRAPEFVEIDAETDPADIPMIVDGNYVRAFVNTNKSSEISAMRGYLEKQGAVGVNIIPQKSVEAKVARTGKSAIAAGATVEGSIGNYITSGGFSNPGPLMLLCNDILDEVRAKK